MQTQFKISDKYEVGAILEDSWGYEQTNIDFYAIIERQGQWLKVQKLKQQTSKEVGFMTNFEKPVFEVDEKELPIRKKLQLVAIQVWNEDSKLLEYSPTDFEERGFSFRNYSGGGWCSLWDGKPSRSTHYA